MRLYCLSSLTRKRYAHKKALKVKAGFTLVELMVSVSILAIGIVLIVRSFITIIAALDSTQNRIYAFNFLSTKMSEMEELSLKSELEIPSDDQGEVTIVNRKATWNFGIDAAGDDELKDKLSEAKLIISYKDGNKNASEVLSEYFENKEK